MRLKLFDHFHYAFEYLFQFIVMGPSFFHSKHIHLNQFDRVLVNFNHGETENVGSGVNTENNFLHQIFLKPESKVTMLE